MMTIVIAMNNYCKDFYYRKKVLCLLNICHFPTARVSIPTVRLNLCCYTHCRCVVNSRVTRVPRDSLRDKRLDAEPRIATRRWSRDTQRSSVFVAADAAAAASNAGARLAYYYYKPPLDVNGKSN